jgi:hypothetical protein
MKLKDNDISRLKEKFDSSMSREKIIEIDDEKKIEDVKFLHMLLCTAAAEDYLFMLPSFVNSNNSADFSCYKVRMPDDKLYILILVSIPVVERTTKGLSGKVMDLFDLLERTFYSLDYMKSFQDTDNKYAYIVSLKSFEEENKE